MFLFKQKSQDFIVEEQLPFELSGKGDAFYVYIEKRNKNTADIIQHLCGKFKISRKTIGIAGLKDKKAIARQWISIYKRALGQLGGEKVRIDALKEVSTVKDTQWHTIPLNMSTGISNRFHIRLRAEKNLSLSEKDNSKKILEELLSKGYPNVFGSQRFGIEGRNKDQGKEILLGVSKLNKIKHPDRKEVIFKLQAYASFLFNSYFYERNKTNLTLLDGDIVELDNTIDDMNYGSWKAENNTVTLFENNHGIQAFKHPKRVSKSIPYDSDSMHLTGPIPGQDLLLPTPTTDAGRKEHAFLKNHEITEKDIAIFNFWKVFGLRRRLRVQPTKTSVRFQGDDILLDFTLPAGSYASTLIDSMKQKLAIKDAHGASKFKKSHSETIQSKRKSKRSNQS